MPELKTVSPRDPALRGSQVAFRFAEGYPVVQAMIERGVIGDFRAPDIMRFGLAPAYLSYAEILGRGGNPERMRARRSLARAALPPPPRRHLKRAPMSEAFDPAKDGAAMNFRGAMSYAIISTSRSCSTRSIR